MNLLLVWHLHGSHGSFANEITEYVGRQIGLSEHIREQERVFKQIKIPGTDGEYPVEKVVLHSVTALTAKAVLG